MSEPPPPDSLPPHSPGPTPQTPVPLGYALPTTTPRPSSIMVLGVIGIVWGGARVLCAPMQIFTLFGSRALTAFIARAAATTMSTTSTSTAAPAIAAGPSPAAWVTVLSVISFVISLTLALMMLTGSIGSVMLKPWARRLMLVYATAALIFGTAGLIMNVTFIAPLMSAAMVGNAARGVSVPLAVISVLIGSLVQLAYPLCVAIFFRKPAVIEAFETNRNA